MESGKYIMGNLGNSEYFIIRFRLTMELIKEKSKANLFNWKTANFSGLEMELACRVNQNQRLAGKATIEQWVAFKQGKLWQQSSYILTMGKGAEQPNSGFPYCD